MLYQSVIDVKSAKDVQISIGWLTSPDDFTYRGRRSMSRPSCGGISSTPPRSGSKPRRRIASAIGSGPRLSAADRMDSSIFSGVMADPGSTAESDAGVTVQCFENDTMSGPRFIMAGLDTGTAGALGVFVAEHIEIGLQSEECR